MIIQRHSLLILFIVGSVSLFADTWDLPKLRKYYSSNREYRLVVHPFSIPNNYSKYWYSSAKKRRKFAAKDTVITECYAILYHIHGSDSIVIWRKNLINRISPQYAFVSNDGSSVVTFDNWSGLGYGPDVMVTYNLNGELQKQFSLKDISPFSLEEYPASISSIHWLCQVSYIDLNTLSITFMNRKKQKLIKYYDLKSQSFLEDKMPEID